MTTYLCGLYLWSIITFLRNERARPSKPDCVEKLQLPRRQYDFKYTTYSHRNSGRLKAIMGRFSLS